MAVDRRKLFYLKVNTGRHGAKLAEISRALSTVFPEATSSHHEMHFALAVRSPPELEEHIRAWFAVILET